MPIEFAIPSIVAALVAGAMIATFVLRSRKRPHAQGHADVALRASEERLQRALDASDLCLWDFDVSSGNIYLSAGWSQLLGGPPEATHTTFATLADLVPQAEQAALHDALREALRDPRVPYRVEHRVRARDGRWLWILSVGRVVQTGADGRALRMLGTNRNISERKCAEAARDTLEEQLRESQKMHAVGTLAAGIAHDFNNILGAILGHLALAREDLGPDNAARLSLEQIGKSASRARHLVQQILAFGRSRPQELHNRPLRPLLEETLSLLRSTLPAGVSLESSISAAPLHVLADATQLQQVLMNLCTNAWHAMRGETGRIVVGLECAELPNAQQALPHALAAGTYAHLWVSDSGCGMDAATRSRIFEPFFTTKPVGQGTGLGLSVAHGIVTSHHGTIHVDSAPGQGSTFHIYLPLAQSVEPAPLSDWGALAPTQAAGQGQHVLYLDDDEVMLVLAKRLLALQGYRVSGFQDPHEALAAVRAHPREFDLVVSDYNMPMLSGLGLAREIASIRADLPILISSGYLSEEQRAELMRSGVRDVLHKERMLEELGPAAQRLVQDAQFRSRQAA
jgi:PAS domain S-box-containing protein